MKRFQAYAVRESQKYSGIMDAENKEEARQKLESQGYQILSLEEVPSRAPVIAAGLLIALFFGAFILWLVTSQKNPRPAGIEKPRRHVRTPLDVVGKWIDLRGGSYLIAGSEQTFAQAMQYKKTNDTKSLGQMFSRNEAGLTDKYGAGQKVYVYTWHDAEHVVEVKFKDTNAVAWVEDRAIL